MKPKLKPPETEPLKLMCDILLSTSAVGFNLRRYSMAPDFAEINREIDEEEEAEEATQKMAAAAARGQAEG